MIISLDGIGKAFEAIRIPIQCSGIKERSACQTGYEGSTNCGATACDIYDLTPGSKFLIVIRIAKTVILIKSKGIGDPETVGRSICNTEITPGLRAFRAAADLIRVCINKKVRRCYACPRGICIPELSVVINVVENVKIPIGCRINKTSRYVQFLGKGPLHAEDTVFGASAVRILSVKPIEEVDISWRDANSKIAASGNTDLSRINDKSSIIVETPFARREREIKASKFCIDPGSHVKGFGI